MNAMPETPTPATPAPSYFPTPQSDPRTKSPALASFLSIFPGLGQIYVGYYPHGFFNAIVIGALIALLSADDLADLTPLAAMFMAFFWLYNVIDAGRRASLLNQALAGNAAIELPSELKLPKLGGSIAGGLFLIVAGGVLLLHTKWGYPLDWIEQWWPAGPMLLGVWLLVRALTDRKSVPRP